MPQLVNHLRRYLPALFANRMAAVSPPASPLGEGPGSAQFAGAVLFADISGFTPLAERLALPRGLPGEEGVELLTEALNRCFGPLIDTIEAHGGDILRFAGDALLALWPSGGRSPVEETRRAAQCGLALQALPRVLAEGGELRMRVSIGAGAVTAMQLGGINGRWELLLSGEPLPQMTEAEHAALPGEVALSSAAWALIEPWAVTEDIGLGIVRLMALREELPPRPLVHLPLPDAAAPILTAFLPRAIVSRLEAGQDQWGAELRRVTVVFIQLEHAPGAANPQGGAELARLQQLVAALQRQIYDHDGSINQLLIDDKGLIALAAFGLPPRMHEDDALRALRAAQAIEAELALRAGEPAAALELAERAALFAGEVDGVFAGGLAARVAGQALAALDAPVAADERFAASLGLLESSGARFELARSHLAWAEALAARGASRTAAAQAQAALAALGDQGAADEIGAARQLAGG